METFKDYISSIKILRTKYNYKYTDQDLENHIDYFRDCWEQNLSYYKTLEWLWFETEEGKQNFKK